MRVDENIGGGMWRWMRSATSATQKGLAVVIEGHDGLQSGGCGAAICCSICQVRSLTQSRGEQGPGPSFRATKTSAFSTNVQSRFSSVVLDGVMGPERLARHT